MITNDAVVSIGIHLLGVGMTLIYIVAMLLTWVVLVPRNEVAMSMVTGWLLVLVFPGTVFFWTMLRVVRSSQKTVFVCFIKVILSSLLVLG